MIPTTFTLLVAAVASTNALPVFSGLFAPRAVAPAATVQRRDNLNSTQFAQGTNFFFSSLLLEAECTPGQVACIDGKTATCSGEANWEVTPCSGNTTCFAIPASTDPTDDSVVVECMTQEDAETAIGSSTISEDFQVTTAPFNSTSIPDPSSSNSTTTDVPSATDEPTPTGDDSTPDPTCTEDPEPTETETITVIAIPNGDNSTDFSYSTVFPTPTDTEVDTDPATTTATETATATIVDAPTTTDCAGTTYQPTSSTTCDDVATLYGISSDDVSNNNQFVDCSNIWAYTVLCLPEGATPSDDGSSSSDTPTTTDDGSTDPAPSDSSTSSTDDTAPTTLVVPPANAAPTPEVSVVNTHAIPASSSIVPPANLKMRKVRRS